MRAAAIGLALAVMLETVGKPGLWTIGLIPLSIGIVLTAVGAFMGRGGRSGLPEGPER